MHGLAYDSGTGVSILGSRSTEVRAFHDMGVHGIVLDSCLPMVLLGLFLGFQFLRNEWIHRKPGAYWSQSHAWHAITWITTHPRTSIRFLPGEYTSTSNITKYQS